MDMQLRIGDEERSVRILPSQSGELRIAMDGEEPKLVRVRRGADGSLFLEVARDGFRERIPFAGHAEGEQRELWVDGRLLRSRRVEAGAASEADDATGLSATIPSVVLELLVAAGDDVSDGQKLILLESMKMVIPILAPHAGRIAEVNCAEGDAVAPGHPLLRFEDAD